MQKDDQDNEDIPEDVKLTRFLRYTKDLQVKLPTGELDKLLDKRWKARLMELGTQETVAIREAKELWLQHKHK
jgi:hypothetical protein